MSEAGSSAAVLHHGHGGGDHHGHHDHGPVDYPKDQQFGLATPGKIAMWFFLCSDGFSFSGLLLSYGILRGASTVWHHPGEPALGINFTAGLTFLLICSSVTMVLAHAAAVENKRKEMLLFLGLTILGGVLCWCGQFKEYFGIGGPGLVDEGLVFGHSAYASTFYLITSFHGCHVFTGVILLTVTFIRALLGQFEGGKHNHIEIAGLFWHFVDLVWTIVFTFVNLISSTPSPP